MIELLISLLVIIIVFGVLYYIITLLPLPPPFPVIAQLVLVSYLVPFLRGPAVVLR